MRRHAAPAWAQALGLFATMLGLALPSIAWGEDDGSPTSVTLAVEVGFDGPDAAPLREAIDERVRTQLDALGHGVRLGGPTELRVTIDWQGDAEVAYALTVTIHRGGEQVAQVSDTCPECGTPELFDRITTCIDDLTGELATPPEEATPPAADLTPNEAIPVDRPRPRLSLVGWLGVAAAGTGAVLGAAGAGVWAKGEEIEQDSMNDALLLVTDYRPPGIALVATGGALLVGGVAMLAIDGARGRRRHARVTASIDPRGTAAAIITGRF